MRILIFYFILVSKRKGAFLKLRVIEKFTNVRLSSFSSLVIKNMLLYMQVSFSFYKVSEFFVLIKLWNFRNVLKRNPDSVWNLFLFFLMLKTAPGELNSRESFLVSVVCYNRSFYFNVVFVMLENEVRAL